MNDPHVHASRVEHLQRGDEGRLRKRVRVAPHEEWPADSVRLAKGDDRCGRGDDVGLIERPVQRGAAMAEVPNATRSDAIDGSGSRS